MKKEQYYPAIHAHGQFHCPHCGVFAKQRWAHLHAVGDAYTKYGYPNHRSNIIDLTPTKGPLEENWTISICEHCGSKAFWLDEKILYPKKIQVEQPNSDLAEDIQKDYFEAANVLFDSPRSAAAILRLALQKLCKQLGEKGENINDDIGELVKKGLNPAIQKSLDALRITGNNAVHPGQLNLTEDSERVIKLFRLINFIAEKTITELKEIDDFYEDLPEGAKEAVKKRDSK